MAAISTSNPLQRLLPLPLLAFITIFLTLLQRVNSTAQLSFIFNRFDPDQQDLVFQGDTAIPRSNVLQLTEVDNRGLGVRHRTGRALFSAPVRLWDSSSGREASFETTFTFNISTHVTVPPADGLAFFIAPPDTTIPVGSNGPLLGLFNGSAANGVVAVEFDTFVNQDLGDPNFRHIGINVNSIRSSAVARWDWQNGGIATATISYDSASKILSVVSSYPNATPVIVTYDINLSTVLPEWVRVGFSATTGVLWSEINDILSWSFSSNLRFNIKAEEEKDGYVASVV